MTGLIVPKYLSELYRIEKDTKGRKGSNKKKKDQ